MQGLDTQKLQTFITQYFNQSVIPSLSQFIKIPNLSRNFDTQWNTNGLLMKAANHLKQWAQGLKIQGLSSQIFKDQEYSPMLITQVKGQINQTILFYGHFDKQPPFQGWKEGMGPTKPVIQNDKLYGRGGADDGYSLYAALLSIKAIKQQGLKTPRFIVLTQGDEESGSIHLNHYLRKFEEKIGVPSFIICLDSRCFDYDRFWLITSVRGNIAATLKVKTLTEGIHSGDGSGITPSCFRIANNLLRRLQDFQTGNFCSQFKVNVPPNRYKQIHRLAELKGEKFIDVYPFCEQTKRVEESVSESLLNRSWRPSLTVTGLTGLPKVQNSGNVLAPQIKIKFSLRLPPTLDPNFAQEKIHTILTSNPPYGAQVSLQNIRISRGWNCRQYDNFFEESISTASKLYFKNQYLSLGSGGTIPLMGMLNQKFPKCQILATGVLGPNSNAHGPNQFLHLPYTKKLICCISHILADISRQGLKKHEKQQLKDL